MKPIIQWAGGKRRILEKLKAHTPNSYKRYFEPFVGGGALLFDTAPKGAYISDINAALIELYCAIRDEPVAVLQQCHQWKNDKETYHHVRGLDRDTVAFGSLTSVFRAARFIYLSKTCFNGLYRIGPNGFNAAWGKGTSVSIDEKNVMNVSEYLKTVQIECHGFEKLPSLVKQNDFVYLDPPYVPINPKHKFFGGYGVEFDLEKQKELRDVCLQLRYLGSHGLLSNSDVPIVNELYSEFNIEHITVGRTFSSDGNNRKPVGEVLVKW